MTWRSGSAILPQRLGGETRTARVRSVRGPPVAKDAQDGISGGSDSTNDLLLDAANRARAYLAGIDSRAVGVSADAESGLARLLQPLPDKPADPGEVLALLDDVCSAATTA